MIRALRELDQPNCKVTIYSDAQYVVNMINGGYAQQWRRDGWMRNKGKDPAMNPDLWEILLDLCARHDAKFIWVRGHANTSCNSRPKPKTFIDNSKTGI